MELFSFAKYLFILVNFGIIYLLKKGNKPDPENSQKKCLVYIKEEEDIFGKILPLLIHLQQMMYDISLYCEGTKKYNYEIFKKIGFKDIKLTFSENDDSFLTSKLEKNEINALFLIDDESINKIESILECLKKENA